MCYKKNPRKKSCKSLLFILLLIFNIINISCFVSAETNDIEWSCKITLTASDGSSNQIDFGESKLASDEKDDYDLIAPPFPPTLPNINTRFLTDLEAPFAELIHEFKRFPDEKKTWTFSAVWLAEPLMNQSENDQITTITISWNQSALKKSEYSIIELQQNNDTIANMLEKNTYSYEAKSNTPHFFIINCSSGTIDNEENNEFKIDNEQPSNTPSFIFIEIISILSIVTLIIIHKKK